MTVTRRSSPSVFGEGRGLCGFLMLLAVAAAARALTFGDPVVHSDEQFYFTVAHGWMRGALPYVDIWDRKPIGLFLLYAPAAALRDPMAGVIAYQAMALVAAAVTAWLVAASARAAGWRHGAGIAGILYLLWLDLADGQGGQAPVFYNAPMALAALLILRGQGRRSHGVAAMALVGLALQIKYSVVFEGAWFGVWLLWRDRRAGWRSRLGYAGALLLAAGLPTLVAATAYAAMGRGAAWWFANVESILRRSAAPASEALGNLAVCVLILAVPVWLAGRGSRRPPADPDAAVTRRFVFGWLAAALAGFVVFGTWFDHYTLPVLVPAWIAAAAVLAGGWWVGALAVVAALAGQASLVEARAGRGTPAEFARLVAAVGRGPGCLYVYSGPSILYPFTGRCRSSRFVYPSHLTRTRESGAIGVDPAAEMRRLFASRPAVVVMGRPFRGEVPAIRALVGRLLADGGYRLTVTRPLGRDRLGIYTRR